MTDKEKIKAEVERLNHLVPYDRKDRHDDGLHDAYFKILQFIDSLEEPVSKELKEAASGYVFKEHKSPLSMIMHQADLKAETQYINDCESCFIAGANWQKEQMMKNSFDAVVCKRGNTYLQEMDKDAIAKVLEGYSNGDKVKLIIVKED